MNSVVFRAASTDELRRLYQFRFRIYVEEQGLAPPGADHMGRLLHDALDDCSVSYGLSSEGAVVGSLRVTHLDDVPDPAPLIAKFAMGPAVDTFGRSALCTTSRFMFDARFARGKGVFQLMREAYRDCAARGIRLVYGDCSLGLLPFYQHLGYRTYATPFTEPGYGMKTPLLMLGRDRQWFAQVRSPLARVAAGYPDDPEARAWFTRLYCADDRPVALPSLTPDRPARE